MKMKRINWSISVLATALTLGVFSSQTHAFSHFLAPSAITKVGNSTSSCWEFNNSSNTHSYGRVGLKSTCNNTTNYLVIPLDVNASTDTGVATSLMSWNRGHLSGCTDA